MFLQIVNIDIKSISIKGEKMSKLKESNNQEKMNCIYSEKVLQ